MYCKKCKWWNGKQMKVYGGCGCSESPFNKFKQLDKFDWLPGNFGCVHFKEKQKIYTIKIKVSHKPFDFNMDFGKLHIFLAEKGFTVLGTEFITEEKTLEEETEKAYNSLTEALMPTGETSALFNEIEKNAAEYIQLQDDVKKLKRQVKLLAQIDAKTSINIDV